MKVFPSLVSNDMNIIISYENGYNYGYYASLHLLMHQDKLPTFCAYTAFLSIDPIFRQIKWAIMECGGVQV